MKVLSFALALSVALVVAPGGLWPQEIVTADRFMQTVSAQYGTVKDYEADIVIRTGSTVMNGTVSSLSPSSMRIDFSQPARQVILFSAGSLNVYIPDLNMTLSQEVGQNSGAAGASLASSDGLSLLRRNYIPSFVSGPEPVPLDANSQERVVKLRLSRRTSSEGFREIILSVNPSSNMIRRMEGTTVAGVGISFDFTNVKVNQGIPELRFVYTPVPGSSTIQNFMFRDNN